jgi:hypothetical protein
MVRTTDNADCWIPPSDPVPDSEPQILFRSDSGEEFDEAHYYGRRPKVELFYRLGVPGGRGTVSTTTSGIFRARICPKMPAPQGEAGWVARLFSGQGALETEGKSAMRARGRPGSLASPTCSTGSMSRR